MKTKEIKTGGGGAGFVNFKIQPGTQIVYIEEFTLRYSEWVGHTPGEVKVSMSCRGPEIEGFEGFAWDRNDPTRGKRNHQTGYIGISQYAFSSKTVGKKTYDRDDEIGKYIAEIMDALGCRQWLNDLDPEGILNLDMWIKAVNAPDAPWRTEPLRVCVAADQYWKPGAEYAQNNLFIVKWKEGTVRFESGNIPESESKVVVWDSNNIDHMKRAIKPGAVAGFKGDSTSEDTDGNTLEQEAALAAIAEDPDEDLPF